MKIPQIFLVFWLVFEAGILLLAGITDKVYVTTNNKTSDNQPLVGTNEGDVGKGCRLDKTIDCEELLGQGAFCGPSRGAELPNKPDPGMCYPKGASSFPPKAEE